MNITTDMKFIQIPVPLIGIEIQRRTAEFIEESFYFRRESEMLLEEVKVMV